MIIVFLSFNEHQTNESKPFQINVVSKISSQRYHKKENILYLSVFDNDPLTFYDANEPNGAWAGIRLEKPQKITKIYYLFRNDDNNIRIGDTYELMYWSESGKWVSAGKQIADKEQITYDNVPSQTLYLLHNHSRGNEERIFTFENGTQIWW